MARAPQLYIFDLDGTLIEFHHDYLYSETQRVMEMLKHPSVSLEQLKSGFSRFDYFSFIEPELRLGFIERFWSMFNWSGFPQPLPFPGVVELLEELVFRGSKVAIATSRYVASQKLREDLRDSGLLPHVHLIVSRRGNHAHWTDKTGLLHQVLRAFSVSPEDSALVGDIPTDISSGRHVGIALNIAVRTGGIEDEVLCRAEPSAIIDSAAQLLESPLLSR